MRPGWLGGEISISISISHLLAARLARSLELELQRLEPLALLLELACRLAPLILRSLPLLQHRREPVRLLQGELEAPHLHIRLQPGSACGYGPRGLRLQPVGTWGPSLLRAL